MSGYDYINAVLSQHYAETSEGLVDKAPSRLSRGEGTEKDFYIMKVDLVGSTGLLMGRKKGTYLKLAHIFLSSIDKITQEFGADPEQTEYAGDSVQAYFPESSTEAEQVIFAASYARAAVLGIHRLDETLRSLQLKCKIVLHFDTLLVSKIGPRANSITSAIGFPLHRVAKLEKEISADTGRATEKFFKKVDRDNRKYFSTVYQETTVPINSLSTPLNTLLSSMGRQPPISEAARLTSLLYPSVQAPPPPVQYRTERSVIGYDLKWLLLFRDLGLNPT